jgi:hypothetical protein
MDVLTCPLASQTLRSMRLTALASIASPVLGIPAVLYGGLPGWCLTVLVASSTLLAAVQVIITQVIRLRASAKITCSEDAVRVLEIEDLPRRPRQQ